MNKKLLYLLIFLSFAKSLAQTNVEFLTVKKKFDTHRNLLNIEFEKRLAKAKDPMTKVMIDSQKNFFLKKLDSIENVAFVGALVKVKNLEDLEKIGLNKNENTTDFPLKEMESVDKMAEYPGGLGLLRGQIAQNVYTENVLQNKDDNSVRTSVGFVVEKDGSISSVKADGDNESFNRQAIIALYLLPEKFKPATLNGTLVRSYYRVPLIINFE